MGPIHLVLHTKSTGLLEGSVGPHWGGLDACSAPGPELSLMKPLCDRLPWEGVGSRPYPSDLGTEKAEEPLVLFPRSPHLGGPTAGLPVLLLPVMSRAFLGNASQESTESRPRSGGEGASRGLVERSGKSQQDSAPTTWGPQPRVVKPHRSVIWGFCDRFFAFAESRRLG